MSKDNTVEGHYKNYLIQTTREESWPCQYYGVFLNVIREKKYKNIALCGMGFGTHASYLLLNMDTLSDLRIIDPMNGNQTNVFVDAIKSLIPKTPDDQFVEMTGLISKLLERYNGRYIWYKKMYNEITNSEIPNGSLDAVFVDMYLEYADTLAALNFWFFKITPGGCIMGEGYWDEDVARAVNEFVGKVGKTLEFICKPGTTYKVYCIRM